MQKTMDRIDDVIRWIEDIICIFTLVGIVGFSTQDNRQIRISYRFFLGRRSEPGIAGGDGDVWKCKSCSHGRPHGIYNSFQVNQSRKKIRIFIRGMIIAITMVFLVFLLVCSIQYTANGTLLSTALKIPRMYYYMSIPIGLGLCIYEYLRALKRKVIDDPVKEEE